MLSFNNLNESKEMKREEIKTDDHQQTKEVDSQAMIKKLYENETIQRFCTSDLKPNTMFNKNLTILILNYTFLLRILLLHVIIVGLTQFAGIQIVLMVMIELFYIIFTLVKYFSKRHLRSIRFLIPRVGQSIFLLIFEISCLWLWWITNYKKIPLKRNIQIHLI